MCLYTHESYAAEESALNLGSLPGVEAGRDRFSRRSLVARSKAQEVNYPDKSGGTCRPDACDGQTEGMDGIEEFLEAQNY